MMLCMCNVIPKANIERPKQKDTVKYIYRQINQNRIFFKKWLTYREIGKKITENQNKGDKQKKKKNKIKWQT